MSHDLDQRVLFRSPTPVSPTSPAPLRTSVETDETQELAPTAPPEPKKLDLSMTQLVGGALAAMTAAALGSRLGLAGTVIGAALASLVAGVGGALYTASLRRGRETVRTVWRWRPVGARSTSGAAVSTATSASPAYAGVASAVPVKQRIIEPVAPAGGRRRLWPRILVGALASFALAAAALTSVELLTGHALSGGTGTTIEQVGSGRTDSGSADTERGNQDQGTDDGAGASADATPSTEPTTEPTTEPGAPEATPTAPTDPATPEPTPSAPTEPSATASPDPDGADPNGAGTGTDSSRVDQGVAQGDEATA